MRPRTIISVTIVGAGLVAVSAINGLGQGSPPTRQGTDAGQEAPMSKDVPRTRPQPQQPSHDLSNIFDGQHAPPSSPVFEQQPDKGQGLGFDFSRDPFNAKKPMQTFDETMKADMTEKQ